MLLLLLACSDDAPRTPHHPKPGPHDTAVEEVPGTGGEDDRGCSSIYDQDRVPRFELWMAEADYDAMVTEYQNPWSATKEYRPAALHYGDEVVDAAVRLKGNQGFSWVGDKMQFVISVNETDPDARIHGVRKIMLDATWYEPTLLRERMTAMVMRDVGLPASCVNNAELWINGAYYGVYANVEYMDHEWLERNFGDAMADGQLWKYGTEYEGEGEPDMRNINALWGVSNNARFNILADEAESILEWAAEAALADGDGHWCCQHNFYLYEHPERGILWLPWDLDFSFDAMPPNYDPRAGYGWPIGVVTAAEPGRGTFIAGIDTLAEAMDPAVLNARLDAWDAQISDLFAEDPHRTQSWQHHDDRVDRMRGQTNSRAGYLRAWAACQRGETADADGDGADVCGDCDDADATVGPSSPETCNLRDDDCDGKIDDNAGCDTCFELAFDESVLLLCEDQLSGDEALARCLEAGGHIGEADRDMDSSILSFHAYYDPITDPYTWKDARFDPSVRTWFDHAGQAVTPRWGPGEPAAGELCAVGQSTGGAWQSEPCEARHPVICRLPDAE